MKIRIRGDSIRFRLSQKEVAQIGAEEFVQDTTHFPQGFRFVYRMETSDTITSIDARYADHQMSVLVPRVQALEWAKNDMVEMKSVVKTVPGHDLFVLIEKDFQCLKARTNENEDESDLFINPNEKHGKCK